MNVKELKEFLESIPDDVEIIKSVPSCEYNLDYVDYVDYYKFVNTDLEYYEHVRELRIDCSCNIIFPHRN